jgi:hypothetical protein
MAKNFRAEKLTGTAGELFTAFELTMLGVSCDLVKQDGTDLIAIKGHGLPIALRVEVKTSTHTKEDCDILALVCLPLRKIQFLPVGMVRGITKRIHKDTFINDSGITERSWKYAVERCLWESSRAIQQCEADLDFEIDGDKYKNK